MKTEIQVLGKDWWKKDREPTDAKRLIIAKPYPVPISDDRLYKTSELASIFRKTPDTICELIRHGKLEGVWDGQWLILGKKYREYLEREQVRKLQRRRR